jgi:hypothetical protein
VNPAPDAAHNPAGAATSSARGLEDGEEVAATCVEDYVAVLEGSLEHTDLLLQLRVSLDSRPAAVAGYSPRSIRRPGGSAVASHSPRGTICAQGQCRVAPVARPARYSIQG